ncbi:MAG: SAM-dependent methyltransferase [Zetaproteobacteria bacterium]|nr:SAM-dependent methyltransferase [Pseudobdellovibrionaceae bacterium]
MNIKIGKFDKKSSMDKTHKQYSLACERNKLAILNILKIHFGENCKILEIAGGTGQHADFFTSQMPGWFWQSSETDQGSLFSIESFYQEAQRKNFLTPIKLSTLDKKWNIGLFEGAFCCNMFHISSWQSCVGLFCHLGKHLLEKSKLLIYGPFIQDNIPTAESNLAFHESLRRKNPLWGIRNLKDVLAVAVKYGFHKDHIHNMPANNLILVLEKNLSLSIK